MLSSFLRELIVFMMIHGDSTRKKFSNETMFHIIILASQIQSFRKQSKESISIIFLLRGLARYHTVAIE